MNFNIKVMNKITLLIFILLPSIVLAQEALIPHEKDGKWGYIAFNTKKLVVPYQYDFAEEYSKIGTAKVKLGDKWGLLDAYGKEKLPVKYDLVKAYERKRDSLNTFKLNGKWGVFDADYNMIFSAKYEEIQKFKRSYYDYGNNSEVSFGRINQIYWKVKKLSLIHI